MFNFFKSNLFQQISEAYDEIHEEIKKLNGFFLCTKKKIDVVDSNDEKKFHKLNKKYLIILLVLLLFIIYLFYNFFTN
jgi:hypothetical protein